jgi:hypothetical protein
VGWAIFLAVLAALVVAWRASRDSRRGRLTAGYVGGGLLVVLGLPVFLGYGGAVFPLILGISILVRTRRVSGRHS